MRDSTWSGGWILAFDSGGKVAYRAGGTTFTTLAADRRACATNGITSRSPPTPAGDRFYLDGALAHTGPAPALRLTVLPWQVMRNGDDVASSRAGAPTRSRSTTEPSTRTR